MICATIDEFGFFKGTIRAEYVADANRAIVVDQMPPAGPLAPLHKWRWSAGAWVPALDHRGKTWYDAAGVGEDFTATAPGDTPPIGWVEWVPGKNKTFNAAARLREAKKAKRAEIKAARDAAEFGGFVWAGSSFDSDPTSQLRIQGAGQRAQREPEKSKTWTLRDNTVRVLSASDIIQVDLALGAHIDAVHARGRVLRTQIDEATTVAAVNAITW